MQNKQMLDHKIIQKMVQLSLEEDIGSGDITTQLLDEKLNIEAIIIAKEEGIICGFPWVEEVFRQLDKEIVLKWQLKEGEKIECDQIVLKLSGNARALLSGERVALNWLQTLSGTATATHFYTTLLEETEAKLLDTRKTLPGLRYAQKYAVQCGGGSNHRIGLYDAFLIKENHLAASSISAAIRQARSLHSDKILEIEVRNLEELKEALREKPDIIMLDNFDLETMAVAAQINRGKVKLEVSGNIKPNELKSIAATGVDYISVGAITKYLKAVDFSMLVNKK